MLNRYKDIVDHTLVDFGSLNLKLGNLLHILIILLITWGLLVLVKKGIYNIKQLDRGKKFSFNTLAKYLIILISSYFILDAVGYNLSALLLGSAALLVGLGMGLKEIFSDFVSGIVLLIDNSIKVGDVIEVGELVCEVKRINLRTTLVMTREDKSILLPNSSITNHKLINWTHTQQTARFDVSVRVEYNVPTSEIETYLLEVAENHQEVHSYPKPFVRLNEFADTGLIFTLYFWSSNLFRVENTKSDVRKAIYKSLQDHGVTIPYPHHILISERGNKTNS